MFDRINVNYQDIVENASAVIGYLTKNSEFFSISVIIKKPYSQFPPSFDYKEQLQPFITKYIFERKDWLVDFLGCAKHQIMVVCRCCKESRKALLQMPNIFLYMDNDVPEDICFYRQGKLWFATISHERMAFFSNSTKEEVEIFKRIITQNKMIKGLTQGTVLNNE